MMRGGDRINKNPPIAWFALLMSILSYATFSPSIAIAQQEVVKTLDEIVIIGTRRQGRTAGRDSRTSRCLQPPVTQRGRLMGRGLFQISHCLVRCSVSNSAARASSSPSSSASAFFPINLNR